MVAAFSAHADCVVLLLEVGTVLSQFVSEAS